MDVREWINELKKTCETGASLRSLGSDVWTRELSAEEAAILMSAAGGESIDLELPEGADTPTIRVGGARALAPTNPYAVARQWYALTALAERGVLAPRAGGEFVLDETARLRGARLKALRILQDQEQPRRPLP